AHAGLWWGLAGPRDPPPLARGGRHRADRGPRYRRGPRMFGGWSSPFFPQANQDRGVPSRSGDGLTHVSASTRGRSLSAQARSGGTPPDATRAADFSVGHRQPGPDNRGARSLHGGPLKASASLRSGPGGRRRTAGAAEAAA